MFDYTQLVQNYQIKKIVKNRRGYHMPLVNLKEILNDAKAKKYAILATDPPIINFAEAIINTAEECKSPIIIQIAEPLDSFFNYSKLLKTLLMMAEQSKVPVAVGLDHGSCFESAIKAIKNGCTFVMFDGSLLSLEENIKITREIVKIAKIFNVSVEGEVGVIGGAESGIYEENFHENNKKNLSNKKDVVRFVKETGVDAVAISIGNMHGISQTKINIDFERIIEIKNSVDIPLVMHGGSGLKDLEYTKVIENGICKLNYYTDLINLANKKALEILNKNNNMNFFTEVLHAVLEKVKDGVENKIKLFGSADRVNLMHL